MGSGQQGDDPRGALPFSYAFCRTPLEHPYIRPPLRTRLQNITCIIAGLVIRHDILGSIILAAHWAQVPRSRQKIGLCKTPSTPHASFAPFSRPNRGCYSGQGPFMLMNVSRSGVSTENVLSTT